MVLRGAKKIWRFLFRAAHLLGCIVLFAACTGGLPLVEQGTAEPTATSGPIDYPKAEVTFRAQIPSPLNADEHLLIEILDEVTGLALNPLRARMEPVDERNYTLKIPVAVGSVVKYRYIRDTSPVEVEYTSLNQQVRYRMYVVNGPGVVEDTVGGWKREPLDGNIGRIRGQVAYRGNNAPVVNGLVAAGGMHTLTASDGSFVIEGLSPGLHNLVVYSLDGSFQPFQQGAVIAPESTTPAFIQVDASKMVNVTFVVTPPAGNMRGIPIRLVGNLVTLGNTFADLRGGVSTLASRTPLMDILPDGRYTLTQKLPAGLDLRYKYTLGDGFWNSERGEDGSIQIRQFIVPNEDVKVEDTVASWRAGDLAPVSFIVTVPASTPPTDTVSIQFNPFGWTEPIPMWTLGNNQWLYVLYNPLQVLQNATYRFCRNDQCGVADAASASGTPLVPGEEEVRVEETITEWAWLNNTEDAVVVPNTQITPRSNNFMAGVAFQPGYHPSWQPYLGGAVQNARDIGSNAIILSPTWHTTHQNPPVMEPVPGLDPLWFDLIGMTVPAQQRGLRTVMHPVLRYEGSPEAWWQSAPRDDGWWQTWFDRYHAFLISHADLAAQTGAEVLIIGDETIQPALPGGMLADGTSANVPGDIEARWRALIQDIRTHYPGKLAWYIPYKGSEPLAPPFLSDVDYIYVEMSPPFSDQDAIDSTGLESAIATALDTSIMKLQEQTAHPVILGLAMPSAQGILDGCVEAETGGCVPISNFEQPDSVPLGIATDVTGQAGVYGAVLSALNNRSWLAGFFAVGYYPPVGLRDATISVRNKPASDVLWYWYPRLTGQVAP